MLTRACCIMAKESVNPELRHRHGCSESYVCDRESMINIVNELGDINKMLCSGEFSKKEREPWHQYTAVSVHWHDKPH